MSTDKTSELMSTYVALVKEARQLLSDEEFVTAIAIAFTTLRLQLDEAADLMQGLVDAVEKRTEQDA